MSATNATSTLQQAGFVVAIVRQKDPPNAGRVIAESPAPGTKAAKGTTVTITVAHK